MTPQETETQLGGVVHLDTQSSAPRGLDLTAAAVYRLTGGGSLDFGGSEYEEASREQLEAELAQPDDDYGWWDLRAGTYFIRFNEDVELDDGNVGLVYPHRRLLAAGGHHPAFQIQGGQSPLEVPIMVAERGLRIKENARVSKLLVLTE